METITIQNLTIEQIEAGLPTVRQSPQDHGVLKAIVIRPAVNERASLEQAELSPEGGVHGDAWANGCWKSLPDGRPHPDVQIALTNARFMDLIAQDESRWSLSGDNLHVDFDLSDENLRPGQRLAIGATILEITAVAHNGCKKYAQRFGKDAVRFVSTPYGKALRLRGIYAKIIQAGVVTVGDVISKI